MPPVIVPPALTIDQLINKYCVTNTSPLITPGRGEVVPQPSTRAGMSNHRAEAFIDGVAFFKAIDQEITSLLNASNASGRFFYIMGWWLELDTLDRIIRVDGSFNAKVKMTAFKLPESDSLMARLVAMSQANINVRVMGWATPFVTNETVAGAAGTFNFPTLMSIKAVREQFNSPESALLNTLAHPLGATHCKLIIAGDQTSVRAYTSGLDPARFRLNAPSANRGIRGWHDVGVRVEGNAAEGMHNFYRSLWNEQLQRTVDKFKLDGTDIVSHDPAWRILVSRSFNNNAPAPIGRQYVQMLRTIPQMNFFENTNPNQKTKLLAQRGALLVPDLGEIVKGTRVKRITKPLLKALETPIHIAIGKAAELRGFSRPKISFAPDGVFEFKVALEKAIANAENYIFIADQAFTGREIMTWIHKRMIAKPTLKVIFIHAPDPDDPANPFLAEAMNQNLAAGLPTEPGGNHQPQNVRFYKWTHDNVVHAKVTLIDDVWCAIGSANCMRRSLYTDIELSVGILEPPTPLAQLPLTPADEANPVAAGKIAPSFIQRFRRDLWAHYCGFPLVATKRTNPQSAKFSALLDLNASLAIWNNACWNTTWGNAIPQVELRPEIQPQMFPFSTDLPFREILYSRQDADSRDMF